MSRHAEKTLGRGALEMTRTQMTRPGQTADRSGRTLACAVIAIIVLLALIVLALLLGPCGGTSSDEAAAESAASEAAPEPTNGGQP